MTVGGPNGPAVKGMYAHARGGVAQDPGSDGGKILRLNDDGSAPSDNPFVGRADYRPEIYTVGNRNAMGLVVRPSTGELWEHENGPADGDEVNILKPGSNYGWPLVGYGQDYGGGIIGGTDAVGTAVGRKEAGTMYMEGMEPPVIVWAPTVAPSGMDFYESDRIPTWRGSLFIGTLKGRHVERYSIMDDGRIFRREWLLGELGQRIRDVRSHDGFLYVLTDMVAGGLLRIEPVEPRK